MSLELCPQAVSQAPQHLRSSETVSLLSHFPWLWHVHGRNKNGCFAVVTARFPWWWKAHFLGWIQRMLWESSQTCGYGCRIFLWMDNWMGRKGRGCDYKIMKIMWLTGKLFSVFFQLENCPQPACVTKDLTLVIHPRDTKISAPRWGVVVRMLLSACAFFSSSEVWLTHLLLVSEMLVWKWSV